MADYSKEFIGLIGALIALVGVLIKLLYKFHKQSIESKEQVVKAYMEFQSTQNEQMDRLSVIIADSTKATVDMKASVDSLRDAAKGSAKITRDLSQLIIKHILKKV